MIFTKKEKVSRTGARTLSRGIQRQRTERLGKEDDSKDDIESKSKEMTAYLARSTAINTFIILSLCGFYFPLFGFLQSMSFPLLSLSSSL